MTYFWQQVAPWIVIALVVFWTLVLPCIAAWGFVKFVRENEQARKVALHELADAILESAPSDESRHQPLGNLVPLWPARHRRDHGGAA